MTLVVVSPHLDDAVFSCGSLLAAQALGNRRPVVVTVCAGVPEDDGYVTQLDRAAGFASSREAVLARRLEDLAAADLLGYDAVHLDVLDGQYDRDDPLDRRGAIRSAVVDAVADLAAIGWAVIAPLGIRHADHRLVREALDPGADAFYAELPYRVLWPEAMPEVAAPDLVLPTCPAKEAAILCYRSQLGDGPPGQELYAAEHYHGLAG